MTAASAAAGRAMAATVARAAAAASTVMAGIKWALEDGWEDGRLTGATKSSSTVQLHCFSSPNALRGLRRGAFQRLKVGRVRRTARRKLGVRSFEQSNTCTESLFPC